MEFSISNNKLTARIKQAGAELCSLYNREINLEYMWSADPAFWGKTSPVLFPIVGALKNNQYVYHDKVYTLPRHGFARERLFQVENHTTNRIVFLLADDEASKTVYPFSFELRIIYSLNNSTLQVEYVVTNTGADTMLFSLGAHPAFRVPLTGATTYSDYMLTFSHTEQAPVWPISRDGLIEDSPVDFLSDTKSLPLTKELFYKDALVFKNLKSNCITIRSAKNIHGLDFTFEQFPFFGIWAAKNADFVCLEPWCGIADSIQHNQILENKEGIQKLPTQQTWSRSWQVRTY